MLAMQELFYEPAEPLRARKSFMLGALDLEPPDGGTKFVKTDGAAKSKFSASSVPSSPQSDAPVHVRFSHTFGADQILAEQPWTSKWSLLRQAAESGNRSTVETILHKLAVQLKNSWRLPPLHMMTESGNSGAVMKLLKYGADPLSYTKKGMNCLHLAAEHGCHDIMLLLLQHNYEEQLPIGQILNLQCRQSPHWTVLHYAAARNQAEVLALLLAQHNIHKNAGDAEGNTALMIACASRSLRALEVLLQNRAAVSPHNNEGKNCLSIAASKGYAEVVEKLLSPEVNSMYHDELNRGIEDGEHHFVNSRDVKDTAGVGEIWTPLHHAAAWNHEEVLRQLASHAHANVNARDSVERTALMVASESGNAMAISILLRNSADVSLRDSLKRTCLHAAASMGHTRVLATLLTIDNLDIDALDCNRNTALIIACEYGHTEAVKQILQRKSALGLVKKQSTAAPGKGVIRKTPHLLSTDSPAPLVNAQMVNKDGRNCLHMAASKGHVDVIAVLLGYQDLVDIDSQDDSGNTALILAARYGEIAAFQLILRRGANVLLCNSAGCNCLHVAAENGQYDVLKLLLVDREDDEFWGVPVGDAEKPYKMADSNQPIRSKKIYTGDLLAWNIVRLQLMEKQSHEHFTCLHLAARGRHIETAILLLRAYLILALKVRGFSRHPRDPDMMPKFLSLVGDVVSQRHTIYTTSSDSDGSNQGQDQSGRTLMIKAIEDFVLRNRLISFCTTFKHVSDQTQPRKYFAVIEKVFGEIQDDSLLVSTFVDAYMDFIAYCNVGDEDQRTFLHHIALADFREAGVEKRAERSMKELLEFPAIDVNAVDLKQDMPLHLATERGNLCVVRHILQSGRTPNLTFENAQKRSPCSIAFNKWKSVVRPNPSASTHRTDEYEAMLILLEKAVIKKLGEKTASEVPFVFQDAEALFLRLLFDHLEGSDRFRAPDSSKRFLGVTKLKMRQATFGGLTLLHYAAYRGLSEELELLLENSEYQSKVNITCSFGDQTPLHFAVDKGHKAVVDILLADDSDQGQLHMWSVRATEDDALHETPLEKAVKYKQDAAERSNDLEFNLYKDIEQMLMSKKDVKDYIDKLYRDRQVYVDASNAILVGAALIASVTFAGWLQPPLGYTEYAQYPVPDAQMTGNSEYESFAAVQQYASVRAFCILNSLSFFFAVATVVCGAGAVLQMQSSRPSSTSIDVKKEVSRMRVWLMVTSTLMAAAIMCVLGAFGAAGYAVLPPDIKYRTDMIVTVSTGAFTCVVCLYCFFKYSGIVRELLEWTFGSHRRKKLQSVPSRFS